MQITTGSRSFASGQGAVVKLRGHSVDEMWFAEGGLKFAMRIQSRNQWRIPVPGILVMLRERLQEAQRYQAEVAAHARGERPDPPEWNPQLEALAVDWPVLLTGVWLVAASLGLTHLLCARRRMMTRLNRRELRTAELASALEGLRKDWPAAVRLGLSGRCRPR